MRTEYIIDNLTVSSVSIKSQKFYEQYPLGEPHRKAYINSESSRHELELEVPENQVNAVFIVWGN